MIAPFEIFYIIVKYIRRDIKNVYNFLMSICIIIILKIISDEILRPFDRHVRCKSNDKSIKNNYIWNIGLPILKSQLITIKLLLIKNTTYENREPLNPNISPQPK